jgi:hypothetical protein
MLVTQFVSLLCWLRLAYGCIGQIQRHLSLVCWVSVELPSQDTSTITSTDDALPWHGLGRSETQKQRKFQYLCGFCTSIRDEWS